MIEIRDDRGNILHRVEGASLEGVSMGNAYLRNAQLKGARLRGSNLRDANLREADLSGADLRDATLANADLSDADLRGADLRGAELRGVNFESANLLQANLEGQNLEGANLRSAYLVHARLQGVSALNLDLTLADLRYADVKDAVFNNCLFGATNLIGVDLAKAKVFAGRGKGAELFEWVGANSFFNATTKWPSLGTYLSFIGFRQLLSAGLYLGMAFGAVAALVTMIFGRSTAITIAGITAFVIGCLVGPVFAAMRPLYRRDVMGDPCSPPAQQTAE